MVVGIVAAVDFTYFVLSGICFFVVVILGESWIKHLLNYHLPLELPLIMQYFKVLVKRI